MLLLFLFSSSLLNALDMWNGQRARVFVCVCVCVCVWEVAREELRTSKEAAGTSHTEEESPTL